MKKPQAQMNVIFNMPPTQTKYTAKEKTIVGTTFILIGSIVTIFFALKVLHYASLINATKETLQRENYHTSCLNIVRQEIKESMFGNLFWCILGVTLVILGLCVIFHIRKRVIEIVIVVGLSALFVAFALFFSVNRIRMPTCSVEDSLTTTAVLQPFNFSVINPHRDNKK